MPTRGRGGQGGLQRTQNTGRADIRWLKVPPPTHTCSFSVTSDLPVWPPVGPVDEPAGDFMLVSPRSHRLNPRPQGKG